MNNQYRSLGTIEFMKLPLFFLTACLSFVSAASIASTPIFMKVVKIKEFTDPGYFVIEEPDGGEVWLPYYYKSFSFDELWEMRDTFPRQAQIRVTEDGQTLTFDNELTGHILGVELIQEAAEQCFQTGVLRECVVGERLALKGQYSHLMQHIKRLDLKGQKMNHVEELDRAVLELSELTENWFALANDGAQSTGYGLDAGLVLNEQYTAAVRLLTFILKTE